MKPRRYGRRFVFKGFRPGFHGTAINAHRRDRVATGTGN